MSEGPIKFEPDGTAVVSLYVGEVVLRRPRLTEFVKLRESLEAMQDKAMPVALRLQEAADWARSLGAEARSTDETQARLIAMREDTAIARDMGEEIRVSWLLEVIQTLAHEVIVEKGDLPPDILDGTWPTDLIEHWKTRPTHPGAR